MFSSEVVKMLYTGFWETIYMTLVSTALGYVIGLPLGVTLAVTGKGGIRENKVVYRILDVISNVIRSIPFLILLILIIPLTRFLVGKSYGSSATIVPLVIAAAPFIARMVESSLQEVDEGVIEAAKSMGAGTWTIIFRVLLVEARTSLIVGVTIRLLCNGRCCRRRRPWRYCHTVWLLQIPDRYHGGNHRHLSADRSGLAGTWNDAFKET